MKTHVLCDDELAQLAVLEPKFFSHTNSRNLRMSVVDQIAENSTVRSNADVVFGLVKQPRHGHCEAVMPITSVFQSEHGHRQ